MATAPTPQSLQGIARLLGSSKGMVFLGVMTAGMVLIFTGKLDPIDAYNKIINLAMVFFPAVAAEDVARNFAQRPAAPQPSPVTVNNTLPPPAPAPPGDT